MFARRDATICAREGVVLKATGWEWTCSSCGEWNIDKEKDKECGTCGIKTNIKEVSGYSWQCPECGRWQNAPANENGHVRCTQCRGQFDIKEKQNEEPQPKTVIAKKVTGKIKHKIPIVAVAVAPPVRKIKKTKKEDPKKDFQEQLSFLQGE